MSAIQQRHDRAAGTDLARFYRQQLDWHGCGDGFQCTRLLVPSTTRTRRPATLRIAVNRLPRLRRDRLGSLLVNPGGPGGSGLDYARAATPIVTEAVRQRYDVVGFDPRGVGAQPPAATASPTGSSTVPRVRRHARRRRPRSAASSAPGRAPGRRLQGATTPRWSPTSAPGTPPATWTCCGPRSATGRLTYLGKCYGTYLGATYAELFPRRVGHLVLDGAVDPASSNLDVARGQGIGFQRALDAFLRRLPAPVVLPARPATAPRPRPRSPTSCSPWTATRCPACGGRPLTQSLAMLGIAVAMYDEGNWAFLRSALRQACVDGDGRGLMLLADYYTDRGAGREVHEQPQRGDLRRQLRRPAATTATSPSTRADAPRPPTVAPLFGPYIAWSNLPCTYWPAPAEGKPVPITRRRCAADPGGGHDPRPGHALRVGAGPGQAADSGHLLTYDGDGHTAYRRGSTCIDRARRRLPARGVLRGRCG